MRERVINIVILLKRSIVGLSLLVCCVCFTACNITKFVPQGEFLLNDVKVKVQDTKQVPSSDLMKYVQQKQNTEILGFWKLQLDIYNTAPEDTASWLSRNARRIGEAPVIYSPDLTESSCWQLTQAMKNKGYFLTQVDTVVTRDKRKVNLIYEVTANQAYSIGEFIEYLKEDGYDEDTIECIHDILRLGLRLVTVGYQVNSYTEYLNLIMLENVTNIKLSFNKILKEVGVD